MVICFDMQSFFLDGLASAEVDVGRGQFIDTLVMS